MVFHASTEQKAHSACTHWDAWQRCQSAVKAHTPVQVKAAKAVSCPSLIFCPKYHKKSLTSLCWVWSSCGKAWVGLLRSASDPKAFRLMSALSEADCNRVAVTAMHCHRATHMTMMQLCKAADCFRTRIILFHGMQSSRRHMVAANALPDHPEQLPSWCDLDQTSLDATQATETWVNVMTARLQKRFIQTDGNR